MVDVVIIGAGPAGLSAAIVCREHGLHTVVLDEFMKPGGRLLGQLHEEPDGSWWNGLEEARKMTERAVQLGVDIRMGVSVHHIEKTDEGFAIYAGPTQWQARNLLLATGAAEAASPIPGWTLPGVMSIGAAQVMANVHRVRAGRRGVIIGVNVLSTAIARELQWAGMEVSAILLPASNPATRDGANPRQVMANLLRIAHLAPSPFLRLGSKLARPAWTRNLALQLFPRSGVKLWGMPVQLRRAAVRINGTEQVESVTVCDVTADGAPISGTERDIAADFVCIAGGLYPLAELAALIGCPFRSIEELGGYVPVHNERMETPVQGLFVAGNITGIESAKVARAQGAVAGLSIAERMSAKPLEQALAAEVARVREVRQAATIQFHPHIDEGRRAVEAAYQEVVAAR